MCVPTHKRIHKRIGGHIYNEILFNYEQGGKCVIYRKMDATRSHQKKIHEFFHMNTVEVLYMYMCLCIYIFMHAHKSVYMTGITTDNLYINYRLIDDQ